MLFKAVGLIAVFIVCSGAGFLKSAELARRVRQLEALHNAVELIATEIRYFASPVEVLMKKLDSLDEYRGLGIFGLCRGYLSERLDFPAAWAKAIDAAAPRLSLDCGDRQTLLWFGSQLGATDEAGQQANCERYAAMLSQRLAEAREAKARRGKMYTSLGVLTGVFFMVLLF